MKNGIAVASVNYRMYPKAKIPEYLIDSAMAVALGKHNIVSYGECDRIYVGGSSAGGYLTQMLCFDNSYLASVGVDADSISGYYMDAGQPTSHFNVLREKGIDSRRIVVDETAPLYFINAERHYPPIRLIVSDNDIPCRLEQNKMLYATFQHIGHYKQRIMLYIILNCMLC